MAFATCINKRVFRYVWSSMLHKVAKKQFASTTKCDVLVIGGGIAGASCSYRFAQRHNMNVVCLEKESNPGYHATGKAFGIFAESNASCKESKLLTMASRPFFESPDAECIDNNDDHFHQSILSKTGLLAISSTDNYSHLFEGQNINSIRRIPISEAIELVPFLKKNEVSDHVIYDESASNFNTGLAYEHFLVGGYNKGVQYYFNQNVLQINKHNNGNWEIESYDAQTNESSRFEASLVVNCCGEWADDLALKAKVKTIGLISQQRSVIAFTYKQMESYTLSKEQQSPWIGWISSNAQEVFFVCCFQDNNGMFFYDDIFGKESIADEMEEMVLHKIGKYTTLEVDKIANKSCGIKCSTPYDKNIVIGPSSDDASFIWCAALGSYGIQLSPAYSEIVSYLALNKQLPQQYIDLGIDVKKLLPSRLV